MRARVRVRFWVRFRARSKNMGRIRDKVCVTWGL
jgi:hypothetical protein